MKKEIETSIKTPFLHILKKNGGYYGICTKSKIEPESVTFFEFQVQKSEIIQNEFEEQFKTLQNSFYEAEEKRSASYSERRKKYEKYRNTCSDYELKCKIEDAQIMPFIENREERERKYREIEERVRRQNREFAGYSQEPEEEPIDKEYFALREAYFNMKGIYDKLSDIIEKINDQSSKIFDPEEVLNKAVNEHFLKYMDENNLPFAKPDYHCVQCDVYVNPSNKSKHNKSDKHINFKAHQQKLIDYTTKVICTCGASILPRNMARHLDSDKHKGIGTEKVVCRCGSYYLPKFEEKHLKSAKHQKYENGEMKINYMRNQYQQNY